MCPYMCVRVCEHVCEIVCTPIPSTKYQPNISNLTNLEICEVKKIFSCARCREIFLGSRKV